MNICVPTHVCIHETEPLWVLLPTAGGRGGEPMTSSAKVLGKGKGLFIQKLYWIKILAEFFH